jgi:hypothetical protein
VNPDCLASRLGCRDPCGFGSWAGRNRPARLGSRGRRRLARHGSPGQGGRGCLAGRNRRRFARRRSRGHDLPGHPGSLGSDGRVGRSRHLASPGLRGPAGRSRRPASPGRRSPIDRRGSSGFRSSADRSRYAGCLGPGRRRPCRESDRPATCGSHRSRGRVAGCCRRGHVRAGQRSAVACGRTRWAGRCVPTPRDHDRRVGRWVATPDPPPIETCTDHHSTRRRALRCRRALRE